jgi:hypothetical protein
MDAYTADFSLEVQGVKGSCPAGENYAQQQIARDAVTVLSCEERVLRKHEFGRRNDKHYGEHAL